MKQITESNLRLIYNLQGDVSSFLSHILNDENYSQDDYDRIFYFIDSYYKKKYEYEKNGTFRLYSPSDYFMRDIFEVLKDFDKGQYMNLLNTYRGTGIFPAKIIRHIANNYAVLTRALIGLLYCYHIFDIDIDDKSIYTSFSNDEELLKQLAGCFVLIAQEQYYQSKSSGKIGTGEDQMSVTSSPSSPTSITKGENTNLFNCTQLPISPDILQLGKEIENVSSTGKGTFIVMSDFHGTFWPIDKIRDYYVNEYDKIYILGDSTDRGIDGCGKGSVKMLLAIKELVDKYPNKIVYLAGNHDDFLYKYMCDKNSKHKDYAKNSLSRNGQTTTMQEFDYLRQSNPTLFNELRDWLEIVRYSQFTNMMEKLII